MPKPVTWKQEQNFASDVLGDILENALEYISEHFAPEDVFSERELSDWAEDNGFSKEE